MAGPETSSEVRRCPSCGARNRGTGQWCTLCHGDLSGPALPTIAETLAGLEDGDAPGDPDADEAEPAFRPTGEVDPKVLDQLMVQLRAQESGIRLTGRFSALQGLLRPGTPKSAMIAFGFGAMVVVALVVIIVLAVVGLAL